jgi:hypothetical protein
MRYRLLGSLTALLAGASLAVAQPIAGSKPVTTPPSGSSLPPPVWSKPEVTSLDACPPECEPVHGGHLWMSAGYRLWWLKPTPAPQPLVTTDPTGEGGEPPGALGQPGTRILYGGTDIEYKSFHGGWITVGCAINDFQTKALEFTFWGLGSAEKTFSRTSDDQGLPTIARPFFSRNPDPDLDSEDVHLVSNPGFIEGAYTGTVQVRSSADVLGGELNLACSVVDVGPLAVDGLIGFRYMYLYEELAIGDRSVSIGGDLFFDQDGDGVSEQLVSFEDPDTGNPLSDGAFVTTSDVFKTSNHFYGGQIGLRGEYTHGAFYVQGKAKVALGMTHHIVKITGTSTAGLPTGERFSTDQGGVLALATNIGEHTGNSFTVLPEGDLNVGFYLTETVRVYVGYSFLYWSKVVRPGEQIDRNVNPTLLPTSDVYDVNAGGPQRPRVVFEKTDMWMHGLNAGFAVHW